MTTRGEAVAVAIGNLLRRDVRQNIYTWLTDNVGDNINEATYPVLSALERYGPSTAAELGVAIGLDRSVVSRHATALERAGMLTRSPDERDRRWTTLALTKAGHQAVAVMRERLIERIEEFLAEWPEDQAESFTTLLTSFTTNGFFTD